MSSVKKSTHWAQKSPFPTNI